MSSFTDAQMKAALPAIVSNIPYEWKGTTFNNSNLLGRDKFSEKLRELVIAKGASITSQDLVDLGNAEDYLRVATNLATIAEFVLATEHGYDVSQCYSFSSNVFPIIAVLLTSNVPVHLYTGTETSFVPFTDAQIDIFRHIGAKLHIHHEAPHAHPGEIVLATHCGDGQFSSNFIDGIICPAVLYINNLTNIRSSEILRIRKRMCTPMTTPMALALLQRKAGVEVTADLEEASEEDKAAFYAHLQELSGTAPNPSANPVVCTAGLPAISSMWMALLATGGADIVMASTAYGGSSELTDIFNARGDHFRKHKFDITGKNDLVLAIKGSLDKLAASAAETPLLPTTVLFMECPTNPDMKVPPIDVLAGVLEQYKVTTGKKVILMVDTTFAPSSKVMEKVSLVAPELTTLVFISMSKSVSRGLTTAGTLVANGAAASCEMLSTVREMAAMLDTVARKDQMAVLCKEHFGVEDRNKGAYAVASAVGSALCDAVKTYCNGYNMELAFVSPENAAHGFTSSTFSFNLPPFEGESAEVNEALAQRFVDLLTVHPEFKPCVSFGQDNGLTYATVPATSTQGAIAIEDKAKQAVGGVQLVRLSFPPSCNVQQVCGIVVKSVETCYQHITKK